MTSLAADAPAVPALRQSQFVIVAVLGALFWFVAALLCQVLGPMGALEGAARALTYAAVIPGTVPVVLLMQRAARLRKDQLAAGMAAATAVAALLDGIALAWFPALYGEGAEQIAASGAVILWGAGVGMILGFVFGRGR